MDHTVTGNRPVFVVVDDPHGHVVPSDGVRIIGPVGRSVAGALARGMMTRLYGGEKVERKVKATQPTIKQRCPKQRLKGLRP